MNRSVALALLGQQCAATTDPVLSIPDLADLLDASAGWTVWAPATPYPSGSIVLPTTRNGHLYRAIVNQQYEPSPAGVSGTVEPIWPLYATPDSQMGLTRPYWGGFSGPLGNYALSMVGDGTLIWAEAGPDSDGPWDIRRATYQAWLMKAGRASQRVTSGSADQRDSYDQVFAHCLAMSRVFAPTGIA